MSVVDETTRYYAARAPIYDESAGYMDLEAEARRTPIKARYQEFFRGHDVLEIACGTGYWTAVLGEVASSILATDVNSSVVRIAEKRCTHLPNVRFQVADAYSLTGVPTGFTAALGMWWWSHIQKDLIRPFLSVLHSKLKPGSLVLFNDQLFYSGNVRRQDADDNTLEHRSLPDGSSFEIIKNFPTQDELRAVLKGVADGVEYIPRPEEKHWDLIYKTKA